MKKLSKGTFQALEMLSQGHDTAKAMKDNGFEVNGAQLGALTRDGFATSEKITLECECCGHKRKVSRYKLTEKGRNRLKDNNQ